MDLQAKREKEREKKRRQREKLKQNEEKLTEAKRKDAERKKLSRQQLKEKAMKYPRKYKDQVEQIRNDTANRVRKHREKKKLEQEHKLINVSSSKTPQAVRRRREKERERIQKLRKEEKKKNAANIKRVHMFRLKVKLQTPVKKCLTCLSKTPEYSTPSETDSDLSTSGYKHKSSETRAFKRVENVLPATPAKKVRILEKILENTTPRSRHALIESETVQSTINSKQSKRKLIAQFSVIHSLRQKYSEEKGKSTSSNIASLKLVAKARKISAAAALLDISRKKLMCAIKRDNMPRKERKDKTDDENIHLVKDFYLEEASRQMPNKRDVIHMKDDEGKKQPVQKHIMEMTQTEAYATFKRKNPDVKIGQRKFDTLKPNHVKRSSVSNRIVCCCTYCENVRLKTQTLNKVRTNNESVSTHTLVKATMCEPTGAYHSYDCIQRECRSCGTHQLREMYKDELQSEGNKNVTWKAWEKKQVQLDETRVVSRVLLTELKGTFSEFFAELEVGLKPHAQHLFRASWQYDQFRNNVENIKEGEVVMAMDFSENYTCRYGREIQSVHWCQKQVTVHPMMLYYKKGNELQKEGLTCITDDLKHDSNAVSDFEKAAVDHLRENNVEVNEIHEWTDGCASQYKCKHSFSTISESEEVLNAKVTRNYFETSHGKGPCDGLGGIIKRKVSNAVIQNNNLSVSDASEMTAFCNENLVSVGGSYSKSRVNKYSASKRSFKHIKNIDHSKSTKVQTLKGSRKLHSVRSTGVAQRLQVRLLSCYCNGCRNKTNCENTDYVQPWKKQILRTETTPTPQNEIPSDNDTPNEPVPRRRRVQQSQIVTPSESDTQNGPSPQTDIQRPDTGPSHTHNDYPNPSPNDFAAVKLDSRSNDCYFAKICEIEDHEVKVEFLEKNGKHYQYRDPQDVSWQHKTDIVSFLNAPEIIVTGSRIKCAFKLTNKQKDALKAYKLK